MKFISLTFILSLCLQNVMAQEEDSVSARIILVGDAGKLNYGRQPVIDAIKQLIPLDKKSTVLFLGDNLYKTNLPPVYASTYAAAKGVLDSQINIVKGTEAQAIFIPGNHDWMDGGPDGLDNIMRQQEYVLNRGEKNVQYLPQDGCPGPVKYKISDQVILLIFDSQWFIQKGKKPGIESDCDFKTEDQFYGEFTDILGDNRDKLVIICDHHPLKSNGIHGGYFTIKQHIFPFTDLNPNWYIPLPVIGSIYPISRSVFGTPEDLKYPAYANMIHKIESIIKGNKGVLMASGHEHNLQLIKDSSHYFIISGAGSKKTRVDKGKRLLYGAQEFGFSVLTISENKNIHIDFYTVNRDSVHHAYSNNLFNFSVLSEEGADSTIIPQTIPERSFHDSVLVSINKEYNEVSGLRKFFSGKNYRKDWATPVKLPVFDIEKTLGGFTIDKMGGGHQTKSLKLEDKDGNTWRLRTVDKDPAGAMPEELRGTIAQKIVQDMISAEEPYGALIVPALATTLNVVHTSPTYYFVPDDPSFGEFRSVFANKVCTLERDVPDSLDSDTKSTAKVITKMIDDSKNHIDQEAVLRARLLDMFIGDYDRHFDQWKFGVTDTGAGKLYFPIPRDRDQAFFDANGLIARLATINALPFLTGFKDNYVRIKWFNWEVRYFDRIFMNNLDGNKWQDAIRFAQHQLTDSTIKQAVEKLPAPILKRNGPAIERKLNNRVKLMDHALMKYYRFLAREVDVPGSNKNEYFKIGNSGDNLSVRVFKMKKDRDSSDLMFQRIFKPSETRFINLYGLNGDDIFQIDSGTISPIRIRIIGGAGVDSFHLQGSNVKTLVYDYKSENNFLEPGKRTRDKMKNSLFINRYDYTAFQYNTTRVPTLSIGYNTEDRILAGVQFSLKTYAWRKVPYSTFQKFSSLFSASTGAFQLKYSGIFNQRIGNYDIVANAEFQNPVLSNFFGFGNKSIKDPGQDIEFYRARYKYVDAHVMIRKRMFNDLLQISAGPEVFHYWNQLENNANKILANPSQIGLDSLSIYSSKTYAGGQLGIQINNINNELFPTRGINWTTTFSSLWGVNNNSKNITKLESNMSVYASFSIPARVVIVLNLGAGHIFNNQFEYFQAMTLGSENYLRGYRKTRFSGQSMAHFSAEFRVKLFQSQSYIVPGDVGLIGFAETGRVWMEKDLSKKWHNDFGGGIYYTPYNFAIVSLTVARSPEDNLLNISLGTKFNLSF